MKGFICAIGLIAASGWSLVLAEANPMTRPPSEPPSIERTSDQVSEDAGTSHQTPLSDIRAFPPLNEHYLQPIPRPSGLPGRSLSFSKVVLGAGFNETKEARCNGKLFCRPAVYRAFDHTTRIEPWFYPASLKAGFRSTLLSEGYRVVPAEEPLFARSAAPVGSLQIGARIKTLNGNMSVDEAKLYGVNPYGEGPRVYSVQEISQAYGELVVEWQIYDTANSRVVHTVTTRGFHNDGGGPVASLAAAMHGAFRQAALALLADREFYKLVNGDTGRTVEGVSDPIGLDTVLLDSQEPLKSKTAMKSLVSIKVGKKETEGFVLSSDGYVLTSATHLGGLREVDVKIGRSRKTVKGTIVRLAPTADVALIRVVSDEPLTPLPLRRAPAVIGEKVYILSNGSSTKRITGALIEIQDGEPGHKVLIADMRHRNKAHGTPLVDINGNVLGMKIRDFLHEETTKKASRYLTIHDALQALRVHALG